MSQQKSAFYRLLFCALFWIVFPAFGQIHQDFQPAFPDLQQPKRLYRSQLDRYSGNSSTITDDDFDPILAARFQHVLDSSLTAKKIMGASAAIIVPEKGTWLGVGGMSNPQTNTKINSDMLFDIGSNTKTAVAALVLKLEEMGFLSINDPLHTWLPIFPNIDSTITVRQLLNHTGGVSDYSNENPAWIDSINADLDRFWPPEYSLSLVLEPNFLPGTSWSYSNTGYVLAGMIIKEATGAPGVSPLLHQLLLDPLRLENTYLDIEDTLGGEMADGWAYFAETDEIINYSQYPRTAIYSSFWTCGAMVSTARELARFTQALYGGEILGPVSLEKMFDIVPFDGSGQVGYGLGTMTQPLHNEKIWWHGGDTFHFGSQALYWPEQNVSIAVLVNQRNYPYDDLYNFMAAALFKEVLRYFDTPHDRIYARHVEQASAFYRAGTDSVDVSVSLYNPDNHQAAVYAKIVNKDGSYVDSTLLLCDGPAGTYTAFSGRLAPVSREDEFTVRVAAHDMQTGTRHTREQMDRFTSVGPLEVESFGYFGKDTEANPGDVLRVKLTLANRGSSAEAENITATMESLDTLVTVPAYSRNFQDIKPAEKKTVIGVFSIKISPACPNGALLPVAVHIKSSDYHFWSDTVFVPVSKPGTFVERREKSLRFFELHQNYPNPFNARTVIGYYLPEFSFVQLDIYSTTGQKVATPVRGRQSPGRHTLVWDARDCASGIYFYRLKAGPFVQMRKLAVVN